VGLFVLIAWGFLVLIAWGFLVFNTWGFLVRSVGGLLIGTTPALIDSEPREREQEGIMSCHLMVALVMTGQLRY
jgi:hypothetical protein